MAGRYVRPSARRSEHDNGATSKAAIAQQGEITAGVSADEFGGDAPAVGKTDLDLLVPLYDVVGGGDEPSALQTIPLAGWRRRPSTVTTAAPGVRRPRRARRRHSPAATTKRVWLTSMMLLA